MNATEFFKQVNAELRAMGYNVREQEGCWSRSNGLTWAEGIPVGHVNHHFVIPLRSPLSNGISNVTYGDSTLQGPKCNYYGGVDPTTGEKVITFISVGPSNNAGMGNASVLARVKADKEPLGWCSVHGLQDNFTAANRFYVGTELHHPGDATPWPDKLIELTVDLNVAMCKVGGWTCNRCIMHAEHSPRKIDMSWRGPQGGFDLRSKIAAKLSNKLQKPSPTPSPVPEIPTEEEETMKLVRNAGHIFAYSPGRFIYVSDPDHLNNGNGRLWDTEKIEEVDDYTVDVLRDNCVGNGEGKGDNLVSVLPSGIGDPQ